MRSKALFTLTAAAVIAASSSFPAAAAQASVSSAAGAITITGTGRQAAPPLKLANGGYLFTRAGGEGFLSVTIFDSAKAIVEAVLLEEKDPCLVGIDDVRFRGGDVFLEVLGQGAWTVMISKADPAAAAPLPQVLSSAELRHGVSKPFKAGAGNLAIAYTFKVKPKGTGLLKICDLRTGKFLAPGVMPAGREAGALTAAVPVAGVFIAQATFPLGSGGGQVRISQ